MVKISRPRNKRVKTRKTLKQRMDAAIASANKQETMEKRLPPEGWLRNSIQREIKKLRELEKWSFRANHRRADFYEYLDAVYRAQDWKDKKESSRWSSWVAALFKVHPRKNTHRIRIVIDASSDQNRRVKSDWSRTLQHALAKKVRKSEFMKFLRKIGGPAGFKAKMASRKKGRTKNQDW